MVFKECLIKLTINNKELHFKTDLLADNIEEIPLFQKKKKKYKFGDSYKFPFFQKCSRFCNSLLIAFAIASYF